MSTVAIKVCGVCSSADALLAQAAGADYIGVVLAPARARSRTLDEAAAIMEGITSAARVGVFVDPEPAFLRSAATRLGLHVVQLHGAEPPALVAALRRAGVPSVWKAVRAIDGPAVTRARALYASLVDGLLLDGGRGGEGETFGWRDIAAARIALPASVKIIVAGGLDARNVGEAIGVLRPDIVDVSTGVEERVGVKSAERLAAFVQEARASAARVGEAG